MHAIRFLSRWLSERAVIAHRARCQALLKVVSAALVGGDLSLTHLGRRLGGTAHEKHQIKAVDRLLGNRHLHRERDRVYAAIAQQVLGGIARPLIVVDWSDFEPGQRFAMLKAAVPLKGRAITVYERVFAFKRYNSPGAHREFLQSLHSVLPPDCRPILLTDAGFRGPWFRQVQSYGWDWVGRIRRGINCFNEDTGRCCSIETLYAQATPTTQHLGERKLGRRRGYRCRLYLVRAHQLRLGRPRKPRRAIEPNGTMYRRLHRQPWLLATSLPHEPGAERRIKRMYEQRMQIEETFRDLKSHRSGLGLRYCRSSNIERMQVLLLIGALAMLALWLVGLCAKELGWTRRFQANTERRRAVLSIVFLGRRLLLRHELVLTERLLYDALRDLRGLLLEALPV
jgi:hypothetical protein